MVVLMVVPASISFNGAATNAVKNNNANTIFNATTFVNADLTEFFPANFTFPAYTLIRFTIFDSDYMTFNSSMQSTFAKYSKVAGVVGNTGIENGTTTITSLNTSIMTHTFTIQQGSVYINIPLGFIDSMTVLFYINNTGNYTWQCMTPCGTGVTGWGGPMSTNGMMKGTVSVVMPVNTTATASTTALAISGTTILYIALSMIAVLSVSTAVLMNIYRKRR